MSVYRIEQTLMSGQENTDMDVLKNNEVLGDTIKRLRATTKLSQEGLGRELNLSWKTVARYETGAELSGDSMLKLIAFCERFKLEDFAQIFRHAYVEEMGAAGERIAYQGFVQLHSAAFAMAEIASKSSEQSVRELAGEADRLIGAAIKKLRRVLPIQSELESIEWRHEYVNERDGTPETEQSPDWVLGFNAVKDALAPPIADDEGQFALAFRMVKMADSIVDTEQSDIK
jgi:DNA-binding transcriptional regulator YiaG